MNEQKKRNILAIGMVWLLVLGAAAAGYRLFLEPYFQQDLVKATGSDGQYDQSVNLTLDAFSGYSVLRSAPMANLLRQDRIKLNIRDDGADYVSRIKALKKQKTDLAVFTVDAFLYAGAELGSYPASIVMVIDETVGADAIVAFKQEVPNLQALDRGDAQIVATPSSPSEFLARTMIATLALPQLPTDWLEEEDGAEKVFERLRTASDQERGFAYVLWEPFVSKALDQPDVHVLLDSSRMKGYIVDVLVASREFIRDQPDVVQKIIEAYSRAAYSYRQNPDGMVRLVQADAKAGGAALTKTEAQKIVDGVQWKNTLENYAHFAVVDNANGGNLDPLDDTIAKIADVLVRTGALEANPIEGKASSIYYDGFLKKMHAAGFHPGKQVDILEGLGPDTDDLAPARTSATLPPLTDDEWQKLETVASMRVEAVSFRRGTAVLSAFSQTELDALSRRFKALPSYYMKVVGHTRKEGDAAANARLASARAEAVRAYLVERGVDPNRLKSQRGKEGSEQAEVSFVLGQKPY